MRPGIVLRCVHEPLRDSHPPSVIVRIGSDAMIGEVLDAMETFLRAAGYYFDGALDIVPNDSTSSNGCS